MIDHWLSQLYFSSFSHLLLHIHSDQMTTWDGRSDDSTSGGDLVLRHVDAAVVVSEVVAVVVHPALRRLATSQQIHCHTGRCDSAPAQTLGRWDRLDDQRSTGRVSVVTNYPRRTTLRYTRWRIGNHIIRYLPNSVKSILSERCLRLLTGLREKSKAGFKQVLIKKIVISHVTETKSRPEDSSTSKRKPTIPDLNITSIKLTQIGTVMNHLTD